MIQFLDRLTASVVSALESERTTLASSIVTFLCVTLVRTGLEQFSDVLSLSVVVLAHYTLCYVCLASCIVLVFHFISKVEIVKVVKVVLPSFVVLVIVPLVDALTPGSGASNLSYFGPGTHDPVAEFLAFGTAQGVDGATLGVRIEISAMMVCSFLYGRYKGIGPTRSVLLVLSLYVTVFVHGLLPFFMQRSTQALGLIYLYTDRLAAYYYLLVIPFTLSWIFFLASKRYFVAILRDLRYLRLAHFLLMFAIGLAFGFKGNDGVVTILRVFEVSMVPFALVLAAIFAIVSNNIQDKRIDALSNPGRPLVAGVVDEMSYARVGWGCLAGALFYAAMSGFPAFFTILFVSATYYLYSAPPVRFKRVLILSKAIIAGNSLAFMMLGWVLAGGRLSDFPGPVTAYIMLGFTLALNFIDLKDEEGDRHAGIQTLPFRVGRATAQKFVGAAFFLVYMAALVAFDSMLWLAPLTFAAGLQALLINRRRYRETPVFGVYLTSVAVFLVYVAYFAN
ncbi:MAG: UbiA family prenyltransferase, partial [Myxococcales bacterium]|nr:UbiA family prenyltransferase [Myxococcales bacterium]